jgi:hypothetical protein
MKAVNYFRKYPLELSLARSFFPFPLGTFIECLSTFPLDFAGKTAL